MELKGKKIILASASPRRRELLAGMGVDFIVDTKNNFVEEILQNIDHEEIPLRMSEGKSYGYHRELNQNEILITSDTLVLCGDKVLGKPKDREDAFQMLKLLSGRSHKVITAVTIRDDMKSKTQSDSTLVNFRTLTDEEIWYYIDKYAPLDKAGAYGVQEWIGYIGISSIEGSFFTVMGFPTHLVYSMLQEFI